MQPGPETTHAPAERTFVEAARRNQIVRAAIDTIAELGYARASLAEIAARARISRGLISYHFAGKEDLIRQVVLDVLAEGVAYIQPRVAERTGSGWLRTYIESNLAFMREHRNHIVAVLEIVRNRATADREHRSFGTDPGRGVRILGEHLASFQATGELRPDFDPDVMAMIIRATIDAAPPRLIFDLDFDIDKYAREVATTFDLATRRT